MNFLKEISLSYVLIVVGIIYFFTAKGYIEVSDTYYSIQTAQSILKEGKLSLNIPHAEMYTIVGKNDLIYSKYGIGLAIYYLPFLFIGHVLALISGIDETIVSGFLISLSNIPIGLLTLFIFYRLLGLFGIEKRHKLLLIMALGIGSVFWRYCIYDFSEALQAMLLLSCIYGLFKNTNKSFLMAGVGFSGLILVKLFSIVYLLAIMIYALIQIVKSKQFKIWFYFICPVLLTIILLAMLNLRRFGNPLETGYGNESSQFSFFLLFKSIPALLFSTDKGILFYCPVLILGFWGWYFFLKKYLSQSILISSIILINLILTGAWWSWYGGWSWGPRLLVPCIALWFIPVSLWLKYSTFHLKLKIFGCFLLIGIFIQIPGIVVKDQQIHHIKEMILTKEEAANAPSDYRMACILMYHKWTYKNEHYSSLDLGMPTNKLISFDRYDTYIGYNLWTELMARNLHQNKIRYLPLIGFIFIALLSVKLFIKIESR